MASNSIAVSVARRSGAAAILNWAPWAVVGAGGLLRLERYVDNRSFWLDESLLGLNLVEKSLNGVLSSLDYVQSAPVGFLVVQEAALGLFGEHEWALRLYPFLCAIAALVLFALVVRRLLRPWTALLALALFAVGEPLIYQSSEAKPYSSDVALSLLVVWLTLRALDSRTDVASLRRVLPLGLVGAGAILLSYPAVFAVAGAFAAIAARAGTRVWKSPAIVVLGTICSASFVAAYALSSRSIAAVRGSLFAGDPEPGSKLADVARLGWYSLTDPGGFQASMRGLAALCLVVGVIAFAKRRPVDPVVLLVLPGALAVLAALLDRYPLGGRFSLFLAPFLLILVARGIDELISTSRRPLLLGLPLVLLLAAPTVGRALARVPEPPTREHIRPLLHQLARNWHPGDGLYVYRNAQYALRFYAECEECGIRPLPFRLKPAVDDGNGSFPAALDSLPPSIVVGKDHVSLAETLEQLDVFRGLRRVWLLFSHVEGEGEGGFNEEQLLLAYLDTIGRRLETWTETGASVYLYDLAPPTG